MGCLRGTRRRVEEFPSATHQDNVTTSTHRGHAVMNGVPWLHRTRCVVRIADDSTLTLTGQSPR